MVTTSSEGARGALSWDRALQWGIALLAGLLVLLPAWPIIYQSVLNRPLYDQERSFTLENFTNVLSNPTFWNIVGYTAIFALFTTILAVGLGTLLALLVVRTDMPGRGLFGSLIIIPYFVSPLVLAFGWTVAFGPQGFFTILIRSNLGLDWNLYSLGGMVVVAAVYYMPFTFLACSASLRLADPQLENAARIGGAGPLGALLSVTLPLLRPALVYSTLFTLVSAMELLSIPLVLGTPSNIDTLSTYLYTLGIVGIHVDYGAIAVVALLLVLMITVLVAIQGRLVSQGRRFVTVGGKASRPLLLRLGWLRWLASCFVGIILLMGVIFPLIGIAAQASTAFLSPFVSPLTVLTTDNFRTIFEEAAYRQSIVNSLLIASIGGAIGIVFMALVALITYRSEFPGKGILRYVALYPRAFPALIIGIGFLWAFLLTPGLGVLRNTLAILIIAFIVNALPMGFSTISPSIIQISPELDRAARVSGTTWIGTVRYILFPLLRPALLSGYILLFITFLKEYAVALFLFARGSQVIGTTMIELWRQGNSGPVSALATVQILLIAVVVLLSQRLLGVKIHE